MIQMSKKTFYVVILILTLFFSKAQHNDGPFADKDEIYNPVHYQKSVNTFTLNNIVDGYTDKQSYNPGDTVKVYINGNGNFSNYLVYLYDILMKKKDSLSSTIYPQTISANNPWLNYGYSKTFNYIIPSHLTSGMYNFGNKIFFIVKSASKNADITIVYPTNTEAAYNNSGGKSLYDFNSSASQKTQVVSFQRPLSYFILNEIQLHSRPFMKWLQSLSGYNVQYIADSDMNSYAEIANSKLLVVIGHSEYWTRLARKNFDDFVDSGNDAAVLSGNTMWWQVRYSDEKSKLVCYKQTANDPENDSLLKTMEWPNPKLGYSVLKSIGADWPHGAYGMNQYHHGNYGYKILLPNSPLLQGTGLASGDILSCKSYEYDATLFSGFDKGGNPIVDATTLGFCNIDLIGYDLGAKATAFYISPYGYGTFIVFKKTPTSGVIVNTGFNTFTGKTPTYGSGGINGYDSLKIRQVVLNIFSKLLTKENVFSEPNACTMAGIKDNAKNPDLISGQLLYPNPGEGHFTLAYRFIDHKNTFIDVYDFSGKKVFTKKIDSTEEANIDLSSLNEGAYLYILYNNGIIVNKNKVIISR